MGEFQAVNHERGKNAPVLILGQGGSLSGGTRALIKDMVGGGAARLAGHAGKSPLQRRQELS